MPSQLRSPVLPANWGIISPDRDDSQRAKSRRKRRSVRLVWQRKLRPMLVVGGAKPATLVPYQTAVNHWESYWRERRISRAKSNNEPPVPRTGGSKSPSFGKTRGPSIETIDRRRLEGFREWLRPGRKKITVNNIVKSLLRILDQAVDCDWLESRPKMKQMPASKAAEKRTLNCDEIDRLYRACEVATWPRFDRPGRKISPVDHWRTAVVMFINFGFRTQELTRFSSGMRALRWQDVHWSPESPGLVSQTNPGGWLKYTPEKQEGVKPDPLTLAISPTVAAHLRLVAPPTVTASSPVLDWPLSKKMLYQTWRRIVMAAGIGHGWQIYHLRKTCETLHNYHSAGGMAGKYITGHAARDVSDAHYHNAELMMARALVEFPQPPSFAAVFVDRQPQLF